MAAFHTLTSIALLTGHLLRRLPAARRRRMSLEERLACLPRRGLPLRVPVRVAWNRHHVSFIEADHDTDLAVALGIVHAHLRLAQMEIMRRLAHGRLAEVLGPVAAPVDHALRVLAPTRAVDAVLARMPEDTRRWQAAFRDGINAMIAHGGPVPEEFALLGVQPEPWTTHDLAALGRLAAADFTWRVWVRLMRLRGRPDWVRVWQRLMADGTGPVPSFAGAAGMEASLFDTLLAMVERSGSNSYAVAPRRSASGAALLASDPHLSVSLPNLWLLVGAKAPGYHAVGLMIPGVPAIALGRNPWIGWGGTNLHAASSDLVDISGLRPDAVTERTETIRVRWGRDRHVRIRETPHGPVITDAPLVADGAERPLALRWIGHAPSDELTALLAVNRARSWDEWRRALDGFAVPAQNMIYADAEGTIGHAMAASLPTRRHGAPPDMTVGPETAPHWQRLLTGRDLPARRNPAEGFVASANNRPDMPTAVPVGYFFSPDDRIRRLRQVLGSGQVIDLKVLEDLQRDVVMPSAGRLRDGFIAAARRSGLPEPGDSALERFFETLQAWDGRYDAEASAPAAFELLVYHFVTALNGPEDVAIYAATWEPWELVLADMERAPPARLDEALRTAFARAAKQWRRHATWGAMHRLRLAHAFGAVPVIGRRYRFGDLPASGSNETLMKTAHGFSGGRHTVRFGANARHISDFADPDRNYFVLLGGQDGWLGSATFMDQVPLWRRSAYVQVPLRPETARPLFPHVTELQP